MPDCCGSSPRIFHDSNWACSQCGCVIKDQEGEQFKFDIIYKPMPFSIPKEDSKCTCGSSSVGSDKHSYYCDIKNG